MSLVHLVDFNSFSSYLSVSIVDENTLCGIDQDFHFSCAEFELNI